MNEQFLHFIWFQRLFLPEQRTSDGRVVEIVDVGQPNTDAGPDVFNAKVRIDGTTWAGNVEFHTLASDWLRHEHQTNAAYNSVILHVVATLDIDEIRTENKHCVPQMVLNFPDSIRQNYELLMSQVGFVRCAKTLPNVPTIVERSWLDRLVIERLEQKTNAIETLLAQNVNNWEETFYITLARSFGFSTNALPFEMLAKSVSNAILGKHRNDSLQIEALLFGQAGMLDQNCSDEYFAALQREYRFLKAKFSLTPIDHSLWKFLRLRPTNFPTIRIAQFANLVVKSHNLFSQIIENCNLNSLRQLFACEPSDYWQTHYTFGEISPMKSKKMSVASENILLINSVIPFLFCYGKHQHNELLQQRAIDLLNELPPEKNNIIGGFAELGIVAENAADSQALIELKRNYCDKHNCLRCQFMKIATKW